MALRGPQAILVTLVAAAVVSSLNYSLVIPLLPLFPAVFDVSASSATWVVIANTVAGAVATPVLGRMGDLWGARRTLLATMTSLGLGSVVCAVAPNLPVMLLGRVLQGAAFATVPLAIGVVRRVLPEQRIALAVGTISATLGIGSGMGITLAGLVLAEWGWRVVFAATGALAVLAVALLAVVVPRERIPRGRGFDMWGGVGLTAGLSLVLVPVSKAVDWGWYRPQVVVVLAVGLAIGALWAWYELRRRDPLIDLRVFRHPPVLGANLVALCLGGLVFCSLLTTVTVIQAPAVTGYGLSRSELVAGLCLIPGNLVMLAAPLPAAWTARKVGTRQLLGIGLLVIAAGFGFRMVFDGSLVEVSLGYFFVQTGIAACLAGLPMCVVANAPRLRTSSAQAVNTTMRMIGTAVVGAGYAGLLSVFYVRAAGRLFPSGTALDLTFAAAVLTGAIAGAIALARRD